MNPRASRREEVLQRIRQAKEERLTLDVRDEQGGLLSTMTPISNTPEQVKLVADWRELAKQWYPTVFAYNLENTARWIDRQVVANPERLLLLLRTPSGEPWGHLGLATFAWQPAPSCELDAVMRGRADLVPGAMTFAVRALLDWTQRSLDIHRIGLRVFADNDRAIRFYERIGFERSRTIPLLFEKGDPVSSWRECKMGEGPERHFLVMELKRTPLSPRPSPAAHSARY